MSRIGKTVLFLMVLFLSRPAVSEPDQASSSESFKVLKQIVRTSEAASSYDLKVNFRIDASDREDTITIKSRGLFRHPYIHLESETPAGMEVRSYGWKSNILHRHPSTDEIVTSDKLGVSSVNRTLLDPFEHMAYIIDSSEPPSSIAMEGTKKIDGNTYRVLRVEVGTGKVREVMNEFRDQLNRPLKPDKTKAVYRVMFDEKTDRIRRIHLDVRSEFVSTDSGSDPEFEDDDNLPPVPGEEKPVTVHVDGQFELTKYGSVPELSIPEFVRRRLKSMKDSEENP